MLAGDGLASVEGIAAPPNRRIRLEKLAGDALASLEGIVAPPNRLSKNLINAATDDALDTV